MNLKYITLKQMPNLIDDASLWFSHAWGIPKEEYYKVMKDYLNGNTDYGWYIALDNLKIVAGLGVIKNDFHARVDLYPNICAVYTDPAYRGNGIAGKLLNLAVEDLKNSGITPVYLITNHMGFYEKYGFEFYNYITTEDGVNRIYIHR